jgi:hypothetical protein
MKPCGGDGTHKLYETFSQCGEPSLTMMQSILEKMLCPWTS